MGTAVVEFKHNPLCLLVMILALSIVWGVSVGILL